MRKFITILLALVMLGVPAGLALAAAPPAQPSAPAPVPPSIAAADQKAFEKGLHKRAGDVTIPAAGAVLHLGAKYYFLDAAEAKDVLVRLWGNPPSAADDVLGLVMPADKTVLDNSWGAVITWDDRGYVSDGDAASADYDKVLDGFRDGEGERNAERKAAGYPEMHLVGWAQPPTYDKATHSLIWAKDFKMSDSAVDSLNYDVRVLGRKGVLSMNMLWDMAHLAEVRSAATDFGHVATFSTGQTYAEYDSNIDRSAGYGLAGLVAGGVAIAVAKKVGILALLLPFVKWIAIGFVAVAAAFRGFIARLFGRKNDTLEG